MTVIAIDPGPDKSALLVWNGDCDGLGSGRVELTRLCPNEDFMPWLRAWGAAPGPAPLVIEKIESYGMGVGAETFETVFWSGRFAEAYGIQNVNRLGRKAIKVHLCNSVRATDSNVRYAIIDRFGGKDKAIGKKANPGVFYDIKSHLWSALAVALTHHDQNYATIPVASAG